MGELDKLANRISKIRIINRWAILLFDTVFSALASFLTLAFVSNFVYELNDQVEIRLWLISILTSVTVFLVSGIYKRIIRHFSVLSIINIFGVCILKVLLLLFIVYLREWEVPFNIFMVVVCLDAVLTSFALISMRVSMIALYDLAVAKLNAGYKQVLIYGVDSTAVTVASNMFASKKFRVVGFVNPDATLREYKISNLPVYHFKTAADLNAFKQRHLIHGIMFTNTSDLHKEADNLVIFTQETGLKNYIIPPVNEVDKDSLTRPFVKEIQIEDLLGRSEIQINMQAISESFEGKTILVTGAAGSIGSELCRQLVGFGVKKLVLFDNAETPLHIIRLELENNYPDLNFIPFIGDVRSEQRLKVVFEQYRPDFVFHAAAYKHVPLMEENPCEAVRVNVTGTRLVAELCVSYGVEKMVMVSTDKAVNPTNVMGASKRLAEIYVQSLGLAIEQGKVEGHTKFVTTRFGNVLGSNGSVIPYFRKQIADGGPVTVTHPEITRYFMTIPEACRLVMDAASMSSGNQIFIFDMGTPVKISDLARRMIELAGLEPDKDIAIKYTGLRPGEKLYEELLSDKENTIPTTHDKIRIAKVRSYDYKEIQDDYKALDKLSFEVRVEDSVRLMKRMVPEFKSKNSGFEKLD